MTADQFRNAILLLNCIDANEFFTAGIEYYDALNVSDEAAAAFGYNHAWSAPGPLALWNAFQKDPVRFYTHASAGQRNVLWGIIEKRLTKGESND